MSLSEQVSSTLVCCAVLAGNLKPSLLPIFFSKSEFGSNKAGPGTGTVPGS